TCFVPDFKVDLHCEENNKAHNTDEISVKRLIVRRGKSFILTFCVDLKSFQALDPLQLAVETGPQASQSLKTKAVFEILPANAAGIGWNARVQAKSSSSVTVAVSSPEDACIGEYSLSVKRGSSSRSIGKFVLLFNPWCEGKFHNERQEYVLNEHGIVYRGQSNGIQPMPWTFGQFEEDVMDICLRLLDVNPKCLRNAKEDCSARCNPIYVSRVLSAMVNAADDKGVLEGKWDGNYCDGVAPMCWSDSVAILRRWDQRNCNCVKYGQCWVFAAVLCTTLRCLGIPCRVVTNFESAHDTDGNLTVDHYCYDLGVTPNAKDNVFFYLCIDIGTSISQYDGWQVVDPTPQERSDGTYCCGPAPVKAILEGHTNLKYDVPFVFAEVNADIVTWRMNSDGTKTRMFSDTKEVGQNISTKAVGSYERMDITRNYKYPEGSAKERQVFEEAVRRCQRLTIRGGISDVSPATPDVSVKIVEVGQSINGKDLDLSLSLRSDQSKPLTLKIQLNARAVLYTGFSISNVWSKAFEVKLLPNKEENLFFSIPFSQYGTCLHGADGIKVTAVVSDIGGSEAMYGAEKTIVPKMPSLTITVSTSFLYHSIPSLLSAILNGKHSKLHTVLHPNDIFPQIMFASYRTTCFSFIPQMYNAAFILYVLL
uniref:protein-glutamine gamma-glutamyltransferase n=1 Tax=Scleropages formosus TaxID=113540 RepID=A0A8C9VEG6_SCLFO